MTVGELRRELALRLDDPIDVTVLLEEATGSRVAELVLRGEEELSKAQVAKALDGAERRSKGEPLQHVVGHWPFRGLELVLDRRALIPRPETELVVESCLQELAHRAVAGQVLRCLDLGTGSGAIALALANERPDVLVVATDVSSDALELARANRDRLQPEVAQRVRFVSGSWYEALSESDLASFDLIVSNPPYLSLAEWDELDPVVRDYDPVGALIAGEEGTEAIAAVLAGGPAYLRPGGSVVLEIGWQQGEQVTAIASGLGARRVEVRVDLAGRDRIVVMEF